MADDWLATEFSRLAALSPKQRQREIDALPADKRAAIKAQNQKVQPPRPKPVHHFPASLFHTVATKVRLPSRKGATRPPRREHRARLPRAGRGGPRRVGAHGGGARRAVLLSVPQARSLPPHIRVHETHLLRTLLKGSSASPQPHRRRDRARRPAATRGLL